MSKKEVNINDSMDKLIAHNFVNFDGVMVERDGAGFKFRGKHYVTRAAVKEQIYLDGEALKKSVNRLK